MSKKIAGVPIPSVNALLVSAVSLVIILAIVRFAPLPEKVKGLFRV